MPTRATGRHDSLGAYCCPQMSVRVADRYIGNRKIVIFTTQPYLFVNTYNTLANNIDKNYIFVCIYCNIAYCNTGNGVLGEKCLIFSRVHFLSYGENWY